MRQFIAVLIALILTSCESGGRKEEDRDRLSAADSLRLMKQGDSIALNAQQVLVKAVMSAIEEGGTAQAVAFCNLQAGPLADSLSQTGHYRIGRISEKFRNPDNQPKNQADSVMLAAFRQDFARGEMPPGRIALNGDSVVYYKGISVAMPVCLSCHGDPAKDIEASTLALIRERYPEDQATGYQVGDFRGLWKIIVLPEK